MESSLARVAIVTPHPWGVPHPANDHILDVLEGLASMRAAGSSVPDVVVIAPSLASVKRRLTRKALRQLAQGSDPTKALDLCRDDEAHGAAVLCLGVPIGRASVAMRADLRLVFGRAGIQLVHIHDPLHGDLARASARLWDGIVLATLHDLPDTGRLQAVTAPLRHRLFESIDQCTAPYEELRGQVAALAEGAVSDIDVVPTLSRTRPERRAHPRTATGKPDTNARGAVLLRGRGDDLFLRGLLKGLAKHPVLEEIDRLYLLERWAPSHRPTIPKALKETISIQRPTVRAAADPIYAASACAVVFPGTPLRLVEEARAAGLVVLDGVDVDGTLSGIRSAIEEVAEEGARHPDEYLPVPEEIAASLAERWTELAGRRRAPAVRQPLGVSNRPCFMDLHMHTSHSWDCATDPEALLWAARKVGLTGIAVTDHNEISGALVCAELADEYGIKVIVGEEVKTSQGEVIGLFLTERIEPGLTWNETIRQIRAQDGVVYVPHPFDRLHTIPDLATLRESVDEIDILEVYNARLTFEQYNRDAERFAKRYNLLEGAGSDAHVMKGLGTAAVQMPDWDDPESFLMAMRDGEIHKRPTSVLMLQGLKLLDSVTGKTKASGAE